jgi:Domain of unknown function (DUF4760)
MDWLAITGFSTAVYCVATIVTAAILLWQLRVVQRANRGQSYLTIVQYVQDESVRQARGVAFGLRAVPLENWSEEQVRAAEKVCTSYDVIGMLARRKLVDEEMIVDSWGDSLRRLWPILEPLISQYRRERDAPEFWDDFEYLAKRAVERARRRRK